VLYAEGSAEHGGAVRLLPAPGHDLSPIHLGPGHLLVQRMVAEHVKCPLEAIRFLSPLRYRGATVRGSQLLNPRVLRSLIAFPANHRRPDLAVVLIDEDGDRSRQSLAASLEGSVLPAVIGLAAPEFEAWLIADHATLCATLRAPVDPPPQSVLPRAAKAYLANAMSVAGIDEDRSNDLRCELASNCNLDVLRRIRGFEAFMKEMGRLVNRQL
jgi:hypothetical protein